MAANPQITNPNNISLGEKIFLPEGCQTAEPLRQKQLALADEPRLAEAREFDPKQKFVDDLLMSVALNPVVNDFLNAECGPAGCLPTEPLFYIISCFPANLNSKSQTFVETRFFLTTIWRTRMSTSCWVGWKLAILAQFHKNTLINRVLKQALPGVDIMCIFRAGAQQFGQQTGLDIY